MEAIIFIGIQASGKSSFYKKRFFNSHIRISLDLFNTRNKETEFLKTCFNTQSRFVIDNTNPTAIERRKYIEQAKVNRYKVIGYYFATSVTDAIKRNNERQGNERIPVPGIRGCFKKLQLPSFKEGFDELYKVELHEDNFIVREWLEEKNDYLE